MCKLFNKIIHKQDTQNTPIQITGKSSIISYILKMLGAK